MTPLEKLVNSIVFCREVSKDPHKIRFTTEGYRKFKISSNIYLWSNSDGPIKNEFFGIPFEVVDGHNRGYDFVITNKAKTLKVEGMFDD